MKTKLLDLLHDHTDALITLGQFQGQQAPIMVKIIFWVLVILSLLGMIGFRDNPIVVRGSAVVIFICLAILGYYTFGF